LEPEAVVLELDERLAAQLREDLLGGGQALREHRAHRDADLEVDVLDARESFGDERFGDEPEVGRHVVRALDVVAVFLRRVGLRERVEERHVRDAEAQLPGDGAHEVARAARARLLQELLEPGELPLLGARAARVGDLDEPLEDGLDGELLGGLVLLEERGLALAPALGAEDLHRGVAQVAALVIAFHDVVVGYARDGVERADDELVGHA
jgi:hypothetical protein